MKGMVCPACLYSTFYRKPGRYDGSSKIRPVHYYCTKCGFHYTDHVTFFDEKEGWTLRRGEK